MKKNLFLGMTLGMVLLANTAFAAFAQQPDALQDTKTA